MKKSVLLKVFALLLVFLIAVPTMTGCGVSVGKDGTIICDNGPYDTTKGKGNSIKMGSVPGTGKFPETIDSTSMVKQPIVIYGASSGVELSKFSGASFKLPVEHFIAHVAVAVCGGSASCGIYNNCGANNFAVSFDPMSIANSALGIGQGLASGVAGVSTGLALAVMVTVWFGNMIMSVIREQFTIESMLKSCMLLIVSIFVIENAVSFAGIFINLLGGGGTNMSATNQFTNQAAAALNTMKASYVAVGLNIPILQTGFPIGYVFIDDIQTAATIAIGCVMVLGAQISCAVAACSALVPAGLEITLRTQLAPLVFALSAQTGWSPPMINYFKGCVAAGLVPALIAAMVNATPQIASSISGGSLLGTAVGLTIAYKAMGGFIGQAGPLVHQVLH